MLLTKWKNRDQNKYNRCVKFELMVNNIIMYTKTVSETEMIYTFISLEYIFFNG